MEINRVSAVYPVIRGKSLKKDSNSDEKSKDGKKREGFEKALSMKKTEGLVVDAKI